MGHVDPLDEDAIPKTIIKHIFPKGYDTKLNKRFTKDYTKPKNLDISQDEFSSYLTTCAWPIQVSKDTLNIAYNDFDVVYQVSVLTGITNDNMYKVSGKFPQARYVSFSTYDLSNGDPIDSLIDYEITTIPQQNNPYADISPVMDTTKGEYEFYITKTGQNGFMNELR